jgi:hypothetical protein
VPVSLPIGMLQLMLTKIIMASGNTHFRVRLAEAIGVSLKCASRLAHHPLAWVILFLIEEPISAAVVTLVSRSSDIQVQYPLQGEQPSNRSFHKGAAYVDGRGHPSLNQVASGHYIMWRVGVQHVADGIIGQQGDGKCLIYPQHPC